MHSTPTSAFATESSLAYRAARHWALLLLVVILIAVITALSDQQATFGSTLTTLMVNASIAIAGWQAGSLITESAFWGALAEGGWMPSNQTTEPTSGPEKS